MALELTEYKNIDFADFLAKHGYSSSTTWAKSKSSRNYMAFENPRFNDRVIVKSTINSFVDVDNSKGYRDIIQFVTDRLNGIFSQFRDHKSDFYNAIAVLDDYLAKPNVKRFEVAPETPAQANQHSFNLKDFVVSETLPRKNYLHTIGIDNEIINSPVFAGKILLVRNPVYGENNEILKHSYGNISFPYIRGVNNPKIVGFEQRNINYKGHSINSDRKNGVWISNYNPHKTTHIVITESAKDALAHYALFKNDKVMYCSVGGNLSKEQMATINRIAKDLNVVKVLGFDNDIAGATFTLQYIFNELNGANALRTAKDEQIFNLVHSPQLEDQLNKFFNAPTREGLLAKPLTIADGVISFSMKAQRQDLIDLTYHILKSNVKQFNGQYLLHRPTEKDFYDSYAKKLEQNKPIKTQLRPSL